MPIAEALSLGVPVIASDIEAHHEVAGKCGTYVDVIDGMSWLSAIQGFLEFSHIAKRIISERHKPRTYAEHVRDSISFINTVFSSAS